MQPLFAYCRVSISPVRGEMKDSAEQVTQLLFGELICVQDKNNNWIKIKTLLDGYEGWIDEKQIAYLTESEMQKWRNDQKICTKSIKINTPVGKVLLPVGAFISATNPSKFNIGNDVFETNYKFAKIKLLSLAKSYLNTPYLWGGKSNFGIDCSGFTQIVFRSLGIELPRDASKQVFLGEEIKHSNSKAGDVAFFTNDAGRVIHVGMLLSKDKIIHASGRVKIDKLDNQGIWSKEFNTYSHTLFKIKRLR